MSIKATDAIALQNLSLFGSSIFHHTFCISGFTLCFLQSFTLCCSVLERFKMLKRKAGIKDEKEEENGICVQNN